jgi:hypothetical protein
MAKGSNKKNLTPVKSLSQIVEIFIRLMEITFHESGKKPPEKTKWLSTTQTVLAIIIIHGH